MNYRIHPVADRALLAWHRGSKDLGHDPAVQRRDHCGQPIRRGDFCKPDSLYGWDVERIDPDELDFGCNLRPVSYRSQGRSQ